MQRTSVKPFVEQVNRLTILPIYPVIPTALFRYGILSWKNRLPLETVSVRYLRLLYYTSAKIGIRIEEKSNGFCHHLAIQILLARTKKEIYFELLIAAIITMIRALEKLGLISIDTPFNDFSQTPQGSLCASAVVHCINCRDPIHPARHFAPF